MDHGHSIGGSMWLQEAAFKSNNVNKYFVLNLRGDIMYVNGDHSDVGVRPIMAINGED